MRIITLRYTNMLFDWISGFCYDIVLRIYLVRLSSKNGHTLSRIRSLR